jgi:hypothetical protein
VSPQIFHLAHAFPHLHMRDLSQAASGAKQVAPVQMLFNIHAGGVGTLVEYSKFWILEEQPRHSQSLLLACSPAHNTPFGHIAIRNVSSCTFIHITDPLCIPHPAEACN